ncbi:MAG: hypothetical protein ACRECP_06945 [Methylocella sp.]
MPTHGEGRHYEERAESGVDVESEASGESRFDVTAKARGSDESNPEAPEGIWIASPSLRSGSQ